MNRRHVIAGLAAAGVAVAAGLYRFTDLFVKHYPATAYDDVLEQLTDRQQAARLGAAVDNAPDAKTLAAQLRAAGDLNASVQADIAAGRLTEVKGWLLPQTIVQLSALAAKI